MATSKNTERLNQAIAEMSAQNTTEYKLTEY